MLPPTSDQAIPGWAVPWLLRQSRYSIRALLLNLQGGWRRFANLRAYGLQRGPTTDPAFRHLAREGADSTVAPSRGEDVLSATSARGAAGLADEAGAGRAHADAAGRAEGGVDRGHPGCERELAARRGRRHGRPVLSPWPALGPRGGPPLASGAALASGTRGLALGGLAFCDRGRAGIHRCRGTGGRWGRLRRGRRPSAVHLFDPLGGCLDAERLPALDVQVVDGQPAGDVVDQALGDADVGVVGDAVGLEDHVGELGHVDLERHAVLQAHADRDRE